MHQKTAGGRGVAGSAVGATAKTTSGVGGLNFNNNINYINFIRVARRGPVTRTAADAETPPSCNGNARCPREGQGKTARVKAGRQSAEASPAHLTR